MNFTEYAEKAKYSEQINAGYSARLNGKKVQVELLGVSREADAYRHGWDMADRHEDAHDQMNKVAGGYEVERVSE